LFTEALGVAVSWYGRIDRTETTVLKRLTRHMGLDFNPPSKDHIGVQTPRGVKALEPLGIYAVVRVRSQQRRALDP